jgi:diphosphomevalonate decarboxylase
MQPNSATSVACANIALIKYWGNRDDSLRIPLNGSISMNLAGFETRTTVTFDPALAADTLLLGRRVINGPATERVSRFLDRVRGLAGMRLCARVESANNFPTGAGMASSASAFAALALAASTAAGLELSEVELSRLARAGSGSACRSTPGGFVEWLSGVDDASSFAISIAPPDHWALVDCVAVVSRRHKSTGSTEGHRLASTSPLQSARVADAPRRLDLCRRAIFERGFPALAQVVEQDSDLMHAVMMTGSPPLHYWQPASLAVMQSVRQWRADGLAALYTVDAGPNVHVICEQTQSAEVRRRLERIPGVEQVLTAEVGGPARLTI